MAKTVPSGVPMPGEQAPEFTLTDDQGEAVSLADLRGRRVILYFYPRANTPGCTKQACAFRDASADLADLDAVVLGLSPDPVKDLVKFRDKQGLNFPLLSDEDHAIAEAYGVWREKSMYGRTYMGIVRSQFVIDTDGTILATDYKIAPAKSVPAAMAALGQS